MKSSKALTIVNKIGLSYGEAKKRIFIKTYVELIKRLRSSSISPQEAHDLVMKNKFQTNKRYFWTMEKIAFYLHIRWLELWKFANTELSLNFPQTNNINERIKFIQSLKFHKKLMKLVNQGKVFSKKIDSCRQTVKNIGFINNFKFYFPNEKFDERKEVQNLQKLVSEKKRHAKKFIKKNWRVYYSTTDKKIFNSIYDNQKGTTSHTYRIIDVIRFTMDQETIDILSK